MVNGWIPTSLGEILRLEKRPVKLIPDKEYAEIGVYSYGRGIFHKRPRTGFEVGDKDLFEIKSGDFIFQITFAWEGAIALASEAEDGMYGSVRFPTYRVNEDICDPKFLLNYFKTEEGRREVGRISPGSAGRNRVLATKRLPEIKVPLPPLTEQRRIVAHIESLAARVNEAQDLREDAITETNVLLHSIKSKVFETEGTTTVKDFADVQSGYAFKSEWFSATGIRLVRNVNIGHGEIRWADTVRIPFEKQNDFPAFELREGDILISLDRPLISSGLKAAKVRKQDLPSLLLQRVGRVIFKNGKVLPDYFYQWLNSPSFISSIDPGRSNGVPHISPKDVEKIPFTPPPLDEQRRIVAYLDGLQAKVHALRGLQVKSGEELSALMPSILDKAFKGEL